MTHLTLNSVAANDKQPKSILATDAKGDIVFTVWADAAFTTNGNDIYHHERQQLNLVADNFHFFYHNIKKADRNLPDPQPGKKKIDLSKMGSEMSLNYLYALYAREFMNSTSYETFADLISQDLILNSAQWATILCEWELKDKCLNDEPKLRLILQKINHEKN